MSRDTLRFDEGWRFLKADVTAAERPEFVDTAWRQVTVPHDWSIEGRVDERNPSGRGGGYFPAGVGWYRKQFRLPAGEAARRVFIEFDGVMSSSDVWINGFHLGKRPYGYVSFRYELTGHLHFGATDSNLLAVRVDNAAQPASRWYAGAGIYRHVRLVITDPVHLEHWSTFVSTPRVAAREATVHIRSTVANQSATPRSVSLEVTILAADGHRVQTAATAAQRVAPGGPATFERDLVIQQPALWSPDHPALYRASIRVRGAGGVLDEEVVPFGIREFRFEPASGLWLNGTNLKIKGVCLHHDGGALGSAVPLSVWQYRLEQLKQIGANAIRTAHNPPAPEFLDLADRMGFLVLDEMFDVWTVGKAPYDYHLYFRDWSETDARDTVRRDRNHPSVFAYSAGNEIHDTPNADLARKILRSLIDVFHTDDPTRPVTQGLFRPNASHDYENGLADMLDLIGQNYRESEILAAHRAQPERKILGTENRHDREVWLALRDNPPYAGQFLWTGADYLGESEGWPAISADFGLLDRTGEFKPRASQRQSWWSGKPMVHMVRRVAPAFTGSEDGAPPRHVQTVFADWTPRNLAPHTEELEVYSNCEQVEIVLNGKSLGSQMRPADDAARTWSVAFEPGRAQAVCRNQGQAQATHELRTAGAPTAIAVTANRTSLSPDWDEVALVTARVVDAAGVPVPAATPLIEFQADGPGSIAAVDNGDLAGHEPFQGYQRHAFEGRAIAIIRALSGKGKITVTASSPGLKSSSIILECK